METLEGAEDVATISARRALEAETGKESVRRNFLPIELVERILAGEKPLRIYRDIGN